MLSKDLTPEEGSAEALIAFGLARTTARRLVGLPHVTPDVVAPLAGLLSPARAGELLQRQCLSPRPPELERQARTVLGRAASAGRPTGQADAIGGVAG
jgi:hypothetical protein